MKRYEQLSIEIARQIAAGVLRPGDRIPSVRKASLAHAVSPGTVLQAYRLLEDRGQIHSRPRSGYFVSAHWKGLPEEPEISRPSEASTAVNVSDLVFEVLDSVKSAAVTQLGSAFIDPASFPLKKLARFLGGAARALPPQRMVVDLPPGNRDLLRAIARRYLESGIGIRTEEIIVTTGGMEALSLCLLAVARPGDCIAIESPCFVAPLQIIERLGMKVVALPTHPREGVDLAALAVALDKNAVQACWFMTNFQHPLGSLMPDEKKRHLVELLAARDVPLIEDDVYEELYFGLEKPKPAKAYDRKGLVLHCSSFSKSLAPGYRIGWATAGRYAPAVERLKWVSTLSSNIPAQAALADYLRLGGYDHHLRALRRNLETQQGKMLQAIGRYFPAATRVTRPRGGYFLWLELPEQVNALELYRQAAKNRISVAPGPIFSPQRGHENCLRLNYGRPWTPRVEAAVATLGQIARSLA